MGPASDSVPHSAYAATLSPPPSPFPSLGSRPGTATDCDSGAARRSSFSPPRSSPSSRRPCGSFWFRLAGMLLSKILTPVAMSGQFLLLHRFTGGTVCVSSSSSPGPPSLVSPPRVLGVLSLVIFGTQLLTRGRLRRARDRRSGPGPSGKYAALATTRFLLILIFPARPSDAPDVFDPPRGPRRAFPVEAVRASVRSVLGAPLRPVHRVHPLRRRADGGGDDGPTMWGWH